MKKTEIRIKVGNGVVNRYEVDKFDKRAKADCEMMGKLIHDLVKESGIDQTMRVIILIVYPANNSWHYDRKDLSLYVNPDASLDECIDMFKKGKLEKVPSDYYYRDMN